MYYTECPEVEKMSTERGFMIREAVLAMGQQRYLKQLAEQRDRRMAQKKRLQKKEADTAATVTTSKDLCPNKSLNNYTKESEECQDVKSDTPGHTSGGEIRQQGQQTELPVYLL